MANTYFKIQILYNSIIKTKSKKLFFAFAILFTLNSFSKINAQSVFCPPNINFENGNLNNWQFYTGYCCPIWASNKTSAILNRHTLTSGSGVDPYGGFPVVAPGGGSFSFKLGNDLDGNEAEKAIYYVRVPAGANNYKIIFKYAVVLEDAAHSASEQPRFTVKAYDSITQVVLPCVNFNFVALGTLPGFKKSAIKKNMDADIYYKTWSSANLDLSGYAGRTVAIEFASGDCSLGGHFGYGYIDIDCDIFKISTISCKGNPISNLAGPIDFYEYKWFDSSFATILGTNRILNIATPTSYNKFKLITKPYPTFGCPDTLTTIIRISDLNLNTQNDTVVCGNKPFLLNNSAQVSSFFQPLNYSWSPALGLSCTNCLNPTLTPIKSQKYVLSVTDINGCIQTDSFNLQMNIYFNQQPKNTSVCVGQNAVLKTKAVGVVPYIYQWKKNGIDIPNANADSLVIYNTNISDSGVYNVLISAACDSILSDSVTLKVNLPIFDNFPVSSKLICPKSNLVLRNKTINDSILTYQWFKDGVSLIGKQKDSLLISNIDNKDTGYYYLVAQGKCGINRSDSVKIKLYNTTKITLPPVAISQCLNTNSAFSVKASGDTSLRFQWKKNNQNMLSRVSDTLLVQNINYSDSGLYQVTVWSLCDSMVSTGVKLNILQNTKIITQPVGFTKCLKTKASIFVKATGTGSMYFQWFKNGNPIVGATKDSLVFKELNYSDSGNYSVVVKSQCDSVVSQIVTIKLFPNNKVNLPKTTYLCTEIGKIGVGQFKSYLWNTGAVTDSIFVPNSGNYWVKYEDFNGCFNADTTQIILNSLPLIKAGIDTIMCNNLELKVNGAAINYDSIFWVENDFGTFANTKLFQTTFKANPTALNNKWLVFAAKNRCGTKLDSFKVYYTPIPNASFELSDTLVCQYSKPIVITPFDTNGVFFGEHIFNRIFTPNVTGIFKVKYNISINYCSSNSEKTIEVVAQPIADFYYKPTNPNIDKPVQFISNSKFANNFVWTFENTTFSTLQNPIYHFLEEGFYQIQLKAINRFCSDTTSKLLYIKGSNNIFIPNAFTPNQNGLNEEFKVLYKNSKGAVLGIYNRWGQLIFTSNNVNKGWDGTFDGNPCQEDVYYYIVDYTNNDNEVKQLKGNFTLIR